MHSIIEIPTSLKQLISADLAYHFQVVPKSMENGVIDFYVAEGHDQPVLKEELALFLGKDITLTEISKELLEKTLYHSFRKKEPATNVGHAGDVSVEDSFLNNIIKEAKDIGGSDIHFEIYQNSGRVRIRLDGVLIEKNTIPLDQYYEVLNKIKIESNLDITEKRLPQDGRIHFKDFDIRVSIIPTLFGEKAVLRILSRNAGLLNLSTIGMDERQFPLYLEAIKKENGIVLISGPTGSGKTTTLYATLKELNDTQRNIVTVEDPIEYTLKGINQVQLKENIGLEFATALKAFLRQDPDIIMLGEIRDAETAKMAIRASLTGHLVLSTIHTNSAIGTISRLVDMGVPAYYIAETLNASVAQRLLRKLCGHCKEQTPYDPKDFPSTYELPDHLSHYYKPVGCPHCYYTGYKGRIAIYELLPISQDVGRLIKSKPNQIEEYLPISYETLADKAFKELQRGTTSVEEVYALLIES